MITFSTDDLRPQDRFDHWCEVRGKSLFGVTIELDREKRASFQGRFSAATIGNAVLAEMTASSYRVGRTPADIARVPGNSLNIGFQIRGPGWMDTGRNGIHLVREGDLTVNHSDEPFMATPERTDGFHFRTLKIPLTAELVPAGRAPRLLPETLKRGESLTRLISATFTALAQRREQIAAPVEDIAHIARLAMIARGRLASGLPEGRAALRAGFRHAAREIMTRELHRPGLTPAVLAAELGISLRQVHVLFEPTGLSFARTLTTMRLEKARRLLETLPARSVTDIAYACGFDSIATFYRVFRSTYGMTPGDVQTGSLGA